MLRIFRMTTAAMVCGILAFGCGSDNKEKGGKGAGKVTAVATAKVMPSQAATTQPVNNKVTGTVTFEQVGSNVNMFADINGLTPGKHGYHIHEKGDLSDPALKSVGGHFDMSGSKHGAPDTTAHHSGDMGNLDADANGHAKLMLTLKNISLDQLVGKSVIVHAGEDDLKTDPSGNSGGRVAGGVIEMKK
jgi:Cu-Zn family superoxide dismutase